MNGQADRKFKVQLSVWRSPFRSVLSVREALKALNPSPRAACPGMMLLLIASLALTAACTSMLDELQPGDASASAYPVTTVPSIGEPGINADSGVTATPALPTVAPSNSPTETADIHDPVDTTPTDVSNVSTTDLTDDTTAEPGSATDGSIDVPSDDTTDVEWQNEPDAAVDPETGAAPAPALMLLQSTPADDADDVGTGIELTLHFNQDVRAGEGFITLALEDSADELERLAVSDARVTFVGAAVVVDWATELRYGTTYLVTVDAGAVASELYATPTEDTIVLRFQTQPPLPLELQGTTPLANSTDVDPNANLVWMFSQGIELHEGELQLWLVGSTNTLVEEFDLNSSRLTVSSNTLVVDPTAVLLNSRTYFLTLSAGMVVSTQGAAFEGVTDATQFRFMTAEAPPEPLLLISTIPADNALNVSPETTVNLRFSEPIRAGSGSIAVVHAQTRVTFESALVTDPRVALSADRATFTLSAPLNMAQSYYVTVDAGAFESLAGASFAGISSASALNFTVQGAPPSCAADEHAATDGCYFLGTSTVNYAAARTACANRGSGWALAEPRSADEQSRIQTLLTTDAWIGATDLQTEGVWRWESDGTQFWSGAATGFPVGGAYTRWRDIEPTGGSHSCARVMYVTEYAGWYWADAPCDYLYQYLCEGPKD